MAERIRTVAVAVCRAGDRLLVERGVDPASAAPFYRAIGGGVRFGERAVDAVVREWREEYGVQLVAPMLVGVLENLFEYGGRPGHEVVFVFRAATTAPPLDGPDVIARCDTDGRPHEAVWAPVEALRSGPVPLVPAGLLDLLLAA